MRCKPRSARAAPFVYPRLDPDTALLHDYDRISLLPLRLLLRCAFDVARCAHSGGQRAASGSGEGHAR